MKKYTKGFTLIELLVVIAIIGILSSVVLVSLNSARNKGKDARIQTSVSQIRTALESGYDGSAYTGMLTGGTTLSIRPTGAAGTPADNIDDLITDITTQQGSGVYGASAAGVYEANGTVVITKNTSNPGTGYAIYAKLPSGGTTCIASDGTTKTSNATYPAAAPANNAVATTCN